MQNIPQNNLILITSSIPQWESSFFVLFTQYYQSDYIKEDEMHMACSTYRRYKELSEYLKIWAGGHTRNYVHLTETGHEHVN
jgi:hypothetical protein